MKATENSVPGGEVILQLAVRFKLGVVVLLEQVDRPIGFGDVPPRVWRVTHVSREGAPELVAEHHVLQVGRR